MKIRFASALFALSLPLFAQEPAAAAAEVTFYKAFYLEKGQRDFAGAMALYQQFLEQAPEHKFAAEAAKQQFALLERTGKAKERDAFKAKYEKLLGNIASAPPAAGGAAGGDGARGERGERPAGGGAGGRMDPAARLAELEKQLEKAKADGDVEAQKRFEQQIERMKQGGGRTAGGQGGQGGGMRGGLMGALRGTKKIADMNDEEIGQLKTGLDQAGGMIDRMREANPEGAGKLEKGVADLKQALDAGNKEDAQKAMDALREAMPQRRRGGGGEGGGGGGR